MRTPRTDQPHDDATGRQNWRASMSVRCTHLDAVKTDRGNTNGCEECLKTGDTWVHLRLCRTCGHVGCCDDSKNRHARKHFHATGHPIASSIEPGETWSWCFVDEVFLRAVASDNTLRSGT
jgi:uncharacterized UBP type Zn finger protein